MGETSLLMFELGGGAVITLVLGVGGFFMKRLVEQMDDRDKERKKHEGELQQQMQNIVEAVIQLQDSERERMAREQERFAQEQERMREFAQFKQAVLALLRDRINQGRRYYCDRGYITQYELENFQSLYEAYHVLGGNGMATKAYNDVCALPFEPPAAA